MKRLSDMNKNTKNSMVTYIIVALMFLFCVVYTETGLASNLFQGILVPICVNVILAISLNLTVGILGELSLGHAGFMCVGAFVGSIFSVAASASIESALIRFPIALLLGGLAAAVIGILVGIPVLRLRGDYLAIVTLAFGEIIKNIVNNLYIVTDLKGLHFALGVDGYNSMDLDASSANVIVNGAMGITGTPKDSTYVIGFVLIFITLIVILNLVNSRSGRAIMAIRDNRIAAEATGINITKYKLIAFALSAFFAGVAGVLYSHNLSSLVATKFDYNYSILVLVFVVLGGIGSMRGSVIAAVILTALPELLRGLNDYRMLIYAIILIVMMLVNNNEKLSYYKEKLFGGIRDKVTGSKRKESKGVS